MKLIRVYFTCLGFELGSEKHMTEVVLKKSGDLKITSGVLGLSVLKTTQVFSFLPFQSNDLPALLKREILAALKFRCHRSVELLIHPNPMIWCAHIYCAGNFPDG